VLFAKKLEKGPFMSAKLRFIAVTLIALAACSKEKPAEPETAQEKQRQSRDDHFTGRAAT
jgi:hypothetical protein